MRLTRLYHAAAGLVASVAAIAFASPAAAQPMAPIPGNGFFLVGPDVAPGLYQTAGTASTFQIWMNDVPTQESMCVWFTYSTPDANKDRRRFAWPEGKVSCRTGLRSRPSGSFAGLIWRTP
jgi:hypothetical protein